MTKNWGYSHGSNGPDEWPKLYGVGSMQSPINIIVPDCHQLIESTCCKCQQSKASVNSVLTSKHNGKVQIKTEGRRAHLDSTGEERSSSSLSSPIESPVQQTDEYDDEDVSEDDNLRNDISKRQVADEHQKIVHHRRHESDKQKTRFCRSNKKIFLGYPRYLQQLRLTNTGHGWQADIPIELSCHTLIAGPPFGDREYRLAQFHSHWGEDCDRGSEHLINGRSYSAEIHFVHWNCADFDSIEEACKHKHGLAVLGVMVQALEGEQNRNKHLDKIIANLKRVKHSGSSAQIDARLDIKKLFPANRWAYASYEGSLTTPPLSEVVDWVVFLEPIQCNTSQIEQFRHLRCLTGSETNDKTERLVKNCRPIQPTNNRLITIWSHH